MDCQKEEDKTTEDEERKKIKAQKILEFVKTVQKNDNLGIIEKMTLHNKFGSLCLSSNQMEKCQKQFELALSLTEDMVMKMNGDQQTIDQIKKGYFFTNIWMNYANYHAQMRNYEQAMQCYKLVIEYSPHAQKNHELYQEIAEILGLDVDWLKNNKHVNNKEAYIDAHTNLAVMYVVSGKDINKAYQICSESIQLNPDQFESYVNFADILRKLDRRKEANQFTWESVQKYIEKEQNKEWNIPQAIEIEQLKQQKIDQNDKITVICLKWGDRYSSEYVNKLYRGIIRNTTYKVDFICYTENSEGVQEGVIIKDLIEKDWKGWWGKASLFSESNGLDGKVMFIDLDMIIVNNIDQLLDLNVPFAILKSDQIDCEQQKDGYNSSIILWNTQYTQLQRIYTVLKNNYEQIQKFIHRFDFWLEQMVDQSIFIQDLFSNPQYVSDFLFNKLQDENTFKRLSDQIHIVCFPRKPKPDDYPAEWIKEYWI